MSSFMKGSRKLPMYFGLILLCVFLQFNCTVKLVYDDSRIEEEFSELPLKVHRGHFDGFEHRFLEIGNVESEVLLVYVHGAPGMGRMWKPFFIDSTTNAELLTVVVDRLGYGGSMYGKSVSSLEVQAKQIHEVIARYPQKKVIVIGHSYGGPITVRLAADYPSDIETIILLAPALDPDKELFTGIARVGKWKLTKWALPKMVRVSCDEKLSHVNELEKLTPLFSKIKAKTIHVHGDKDWIVPFSNLAFAEKQFNPEIFTPIYLKDGDHFLIEGKRQEEMMQLILHEVDALKSK